MATAWRPSWRFADHLNIVFQLQHLAKPLAHNRMVFREQNSDFFHKIFRV